MKAEMRQLWVRRPLFYLAVGLVFLAFCEEFLGNFAWLAAVPWVWLAFVGGRWKGCGWAVLTSIFLLSSTQWTKQVQAADEAFFTHLGIREMQGRLLEDGDGDDGRWTAIAQLEGGDFSGKKVKWIGSGEPPPAGTMLRANGIFGNLQTERNPGTIDRSKRLRDLGVVASFRASEMRADQWTGPVAVWAAHVRKTFRDGIVAGLDENGIEAKTIRAMVLGEKARDSMELIDAFRNSGTLHVFSVSGLHVAMLGSIVWFVLKWCGVVRRWAIPAIIVVMFGYVWLTGNGPAALRAAWMGTIFLSAFMLRRRADLLNTLGAVLLISMLIDSRVIRMPGVQLSYGVVAAIGMLTVCARKWFGWIAAEEDFLPDRESGRWRKGWLIFRRKLADSLAVSSAASLGSVPLTMFHFGLFTPISVIGTVVLVPLVYWLLSLALAAAVVYPVWQGGAVLLNRGNAMIARASVETAEFFAAIPGASVSTNVRESDSLVIYDLPFGNSAACFGAARHHAVLIDSGNDRSMEIEVGPSLRRLGLEPDSMLISHADSGHACTPQLLREIFPIQQVAMGVDLAGSELASGWKKLSSGGVRQAFLRKGDRFKLGGGAYGEVLHSAADGQASSLTDDQCLVFMMHWKGWKILWTSDAGRHAEAAMLASGTDLKADAIIAGIHETDFSLTPDFLEKVDPELIVIGSPASSEMDTSRTIQQGKWRKKGIRVLAMEQTGGITVTCEEGLVFSGYFDGSRTVLKR